MLDRSRKQAILDAIAPVPICQALAFNILELDEGLCRMTVPFDERLVGIHGVVHGGILTTIADSIACFAIMTHTGPHRPMTTTDLNVRFLAPCRGEVTAVARVLKIGRTLCPVTVDLLDAAGVLCAVAQVTYLLLDRPPTGVPGRPEKGG